MIVINISTTQQAQWRKSIDMLARISCCGVGLLKVNQDDCLEPFTAVGIDRDNLENLCQICAASDLNNASSTSSFSNTSTKTAQPASNDSLFESGLSCCVAIHWPSQALFGYLCLTTPAKQNTHSLNKADLRLLLKQCADSFELDLLSIYRHYRKSIQRENDAETAVTKVSLQQFIDTMKEHVWMKNPQGRYVIINHSVEVAWDMSRAQILNHTDEELFNPQLAKQFVDGDKESVTKGVQITAGECQGLDIGDVESWLETTKVPIVADTGELTGIIGISRNISSHKAAQDQLELAARVFENSVEGVLITDVGGNIIDAHGAFTHITGFDKSELIGQNPKMFNSGRHDKAFFNNLWKSLLNTGKWHGEIWNRHKNGAVFPQLLTISAVYGDEHQIRYFVAVFADLSTQKKNEAELVHLAFHDPLTKLPNRMAVTSRLEQEIRLANRSEYQLGVVYIDVDLFKQINDSFGHLMGDEVLVKLSHRLSLALGSLATVARLGGDEFAVILPSIESSDMLSLRISTLQHVFERPFLLGDNAPVRLTASMGVAIYPQDGRDSSTLLVNADAAMHRAKHDGRNNYAFYTESLTYESVAHLKLQSALHDALSQDALYLVYQPKVDCRSQQLSGFEALLRWEDPVLGRISPAIFIPVAEKIGLIQEIGRWVLQQACEQGVRWLAEGKDFVRIAVNVAAQQLQRRNFVNEVAEVLKATGLPANRLELEVTESCMMTDPESVGRDLVKLGNMGIMLSIDDFGTGYSSLNYLKKLPINKLKIDQSFVRDIPDDVHNTAIAKAVIALGHSLNLKVIAEGVETVEQAQFLADYGCDEAQGYLFSKPKLAAELNHFFVNEGCINDSPNDEC
ncbi:GGDEF domain-containing protein [Shewanella sp. Choline-02u-19]|uniref:putative bifunctional diguanylate cyclase/phosphodiesterase n=1 Tax=unclassified Shewanella TaxID=196818 RepID=UPI000C32DE06|nr:MULTISPECIES: bifunctional diguanylate cyclase/phosphodiesterase [unclassified Shewanella]PKH56408.1 GGDEF domain-containing protein [Shewanella sp. Bg11-22]PKI30037.1 GGDEF domain-containing protein [Shewanella sp. Choline-02u-19]